NLRRRPPARQRGRLCGGATEHPGRRHLQRGLLLGLRRHRPVAGSPTAGDRGACSAAARATSGTLLTLEGRGGTTMNPSDRIVVTIFFGIFVEALPFLLAGVLVSSAIHLFVTPERMQRLLPRRPLGAALAGATL